MAKQLNRVSAMQYAIVQQVRAGERRTGACVRGCLAREGSGSTQGKLQRLNQRRCRRGDRLGTSSICSTPGWRDNHVRSLFMWHIWTLFMWHMWTIDQHDGTNRLELWLNAGAMDVFEHLYRMPAAYQQVR